MKKYTMPMLSKLRLELPHNFNQIVLLGTKWIIK